MASTCMDGILLDLKLLLNNSRKCYGCLPVHPSKVVEVIEDLEFLKTFLVCAGKWSLSNDFYFESYNCAKNKGSLPSLLSFTKSLKVKTFLLCARKWKKVSLQSFLSCVEDTVNKYEEFIHSLALKSRTLSGTTPEICQVFCEFEEQIKSFKKDIIQVYITLASYSSVQSNSCMRDDELVEFIDLILQNLAHLLTGQPSIYAPLHGEVLALEGKLTFLKSFISFAKLRGTVDIPALLLTHTEVVALNAARLSYMCSFWNDAEERRNAGYCTMICEQLQKIRPIDFHVFEIYKQVLAASSTSTSFHTTVMDQQILNNFNDSLVSCLWDLLCCSSSFMDSVKEDMQVLYAGLRFLRSILREPREQMDQLNNKIGALLSKAGIIICMLSLNRVKEAESNPLESTKALDCYDMLVHTSTLIKHVKDHVGGSSTIGSTLPSFHSLDVQQVCKPSWRMASKGKLPITPEVIIGLDDEAEKVIDRLISGPKQVEIVPIMGMAGLGKTTMARKVFNDDSIVYNFHIRFWCTVSQVFNLKSLLLQILCCDDKHSGMNC